MDGEVAERVVETEDCAPEGVSDNIQALIEEAKKNGISIHGTGGKALEGAPMTYHTDGVTTSISVHLPAEKAGRLRVFLTPPDSITEADARTAALDELSQRAYENAKAKGFHDSEPPITIAERIALMHSELSEMLEEHRARRGMDEVYSVDRHGARLEWHLDMLELLDLHDQPMKPEGIPIEAADLQIRLLDFCRLYGIDLGLNTERKMRYNATRPHMHGKAL